MKVNLLPYQLAQKAGPNWRTIFLLGGMVLLAGVTLIFYVALQGQVNKFMADIAAVKRDYEQYTAALERKATLDQLQASYTEKQGFIMQLSGEGVKWNDIMDELRSIIPKTVVLDTVSSDETGHMVLEGRAGGLIALSQFHNNIQDSATMAAPDVKSVLWDIEGAFFKFVLECDAKQAVGDGG
ncbi:MAG: hypothetical protein C4551_05385 [Bacillota bacterium]|nr:MAG: hypothetical protein C4551_05385 [Bacillota bacterium]